MATYPTADWSDIVQDGADFTERTVNIDLVFTAGTSGAVPTALTRSKGIASVVLTSNEYLITLQNIWAELEQVTASNVQASLSASGASYGVPSTVNVGAGSTSPNTVGITFQKGSDGTGTPVATGDIVRVTLRLKR